MMSSRSSGGHGAVRPGEHGELTDESCVQFAGFVAPDAEIGRTVGELLNLVD